MNSEKEDTVMIPYSGVSTVSERAGAPIADPGHVVRIPTENPSFNSINFAKIINKNYLGNQKTNTNQANKSSSILGHETAVFMPDDLPDDLIVLHFSPLNRTLEIV